MPRLPLVLAVLLIACSSQSKPDECPACPECDARPASVRLFRSSIVPDGKLIHVATFDVQDSCGSKCPEYNLENCEVARKLFQGQPGVDVGYVCQKDGEKLAGAPPSGDADEACAVGSERCACTGGGACDPGLTCASTICVRVDDPKSAVAMQDQWADEVCRCADMECVKGVQKEQELWIVKHGAQMTATEHDAKRIERATQKMTECLTEMMTR